MNLDQQGDAPAAESRSHGITENRRAQGTGGSGQSLSRPKQAILREASGWKSFESRTPSPEPRRGRSFVQALNPFVIDRNSAVVHHGAVVIEVESLRGSRRLASPKTS